MTRARVSALIAAATLAGAPATALGQNAGDDQYQDPFGDSSPQSNSNSSPTPTATPAPIQETAPGVSSAPAPSSSGSSQAPSAPAAPAPTAGDQLPRTGSEPAVIGLFGMSLILCGAGLRLRLRPAGLPHGERPA
jgi:hypothetical protein